MHTHVNQINKENKESILTYINEQKIRSVIINNQIYIAARDLLLHLGYHSTSIAKIINSTCKNRIVHPCKSGDKEVRLAFIPLSDILKIVMRCRFREANPLKEMLFENVSDMLTLH